MLTIRVCISLVLAFALAACSPDYNWRQVQVADGLVTAFFPDKPRTETRNLDYAGQQVAFSLTSVAVNDALFAVGYAALPASMDADPAARAEFAKAVIDSMYRSVGAQAPATLPASGEIFVIEGTAAGNTLRMSAAVWLTDRGLVEGVVTAQAQAYPQAQAEEFLRGIRTAR